MASESHLRSELRFIEEQLSVSSRLLPFIVGIATIRQHLDQTTGSQPPPEGDEDGEEGIVVINPTTFRAIFLGFGRGSDVAKSGPAPASNPAIESLPVAAVAEEERGSECVICLEELMVAEEAKSMPCKHRFHPGCIDKWLRIHGSCPVCRFLMPVEGLEGKKGVDGGDGGRVGDGRELEMSVRLLVGGRNSDGSNSNSDSDRGLGVSDRMSVSGGAVYVGPESGAGVVDGSGGQDTEL